MKNLNPGPDSCRRVGVIGLGLLPEQMPTKITVKVSHGPDQYEVSLPSTSTFGYLKSFIAQSIGLNPETHKILFGGEEKHDDENLGTSGVTDNSELLLMEDVTCEQETTEEVNETIVISKGEEDVAQVRQEIDKLEQQVNAMQAVVDTGTTISEKEISYLTEMLMKQLLKLDGIEAAGEGRTQRKTEVRRVQNIVEKLDSLKSIIASGTTRSIHTRI